ncbi:MULTISPECIES: hypothetical protein [Pseudomonas]|jgi:hypothetical protein|uniref:hypothetical protein n=1 Tax=Pseudomonas TaxID=286 RepID=UPI00044F94E8|nr:MULTISPECIES: hypothetical protein [Pseudomonas]EZP67941.1 hypothetical protein BW43_01307 [Pseudomonas sp. RIT357]
MTKIIGVHGIGHQFGGANSLREKWLPALKDGVTLAGHHLPEDVSFDCAFYGDLFRPTGKSAGSVHDVSDASEWEAQLLQMWWEEAARTYPNVRAPDEATKSWVMAGAHKALSALTNASYFSGILESLMFSDLRQVFRYFHDHVVRAKAQASIAKLITDDTRVIVAHSLGSVVAYEALCANPQWPVTHLITLGSPLGVRNLIFDALEPTPTEGKGHWPAGVECWTNISSGDDIVALTKALEPLFMPTIVDLSISNGAKAHDACRYLTTREVGHAIAAAF